MHGLMSYRRFGRARSLRSDRAERTLGRYIATGHGSSSSAPNVLAAAAEQLVPALEWSAATVASTAA
ncbi:hypothetical protein F2Q69_00005204 [Brassica cretica]|uniref:Uncharacterized protein n=1 Tax=Brassica cretica TaxID=69181 RepID=A0A8S9P317_BRACR|nr:hypothetical protein F2Q69_00005204 [Brassica cretica]